MLAAWSEFVKGKRKRKDVQEFSRNLMGDTLNLHHDLAVGVYRHGGYEHFKISDPKPRDIHKASVRDRLVHHAICRVLYPLFDQTFIHDSYSCRLGKGTHRAMNAFRKYSYKASRNHTKTLWILKCDIRKFFASIDHGILLSILRHRIHDESVATLLEGVVKSFYSTAPGKGLPLGNLTSQLLVNVYMNEFDWFVKHDLKARWYVRYADDFIILSTDYSELVSLISRIRAFLWYKLKLELHPNKVSIRTLASGSDFLGWVHFTGHRVLRASTKRRMLRRITQTHGKEETVLSYRGMLKHGNSYKVRRKIDQTLTLIKK